MTAAIAAIAAQGLDSTSSRPVGGGAVLTVVVAGAILALSGEFAALTDARTCAALTGAAGLVNVIWRCSPTTERASAGNHQCLLSVPCRAGAWR
ncbi:MAG: hypothetical protein H0W96_15560 [Solirubrobacterales bacterium]|nr:hypothetical protein [Solirubrobacterales bacterium]